MANGDDDDVSLEYLPLVIPVMFLELLIFNYYIYCDWKRRLMSSGDSNVPFFSRPENLTWLTECPWDQLSGVCIGVNSFSISKSMWGGWWDIALFIHRLICLVIFLIVGIFIQFSMRPIIEWQMFTNWNLLAIGIYYLIVTTYSFTETGWPLQNILFKYSFFNEYVL